MKRRPWFPLYAVDWLMDEHVRAMTPEQRGVYLDLLCKCWLEGSISADPIALANSLHLHRGRFVNTIWPGVQPRFISDHTGTRLVSRRLEAVRHEVEEVSEKRRKAAKDKWSAHANAEQMQSKCNANAMLSQHSTSQHKEETNTSPAAPRLSFDFEALYQRYPNKKGKAKGLAVLRSAIRTQADYDAVLGGVTRYAAEVRRNGTELRFVKHFATWVHQRCWLDYAEGEAKSEAPATAQPRPLTLFERIQAREAEEEAARERNRAATGEP